MDWIQGAEAKLLKAAKISSPDRAHSYAELVAKIDTPESRKFLPELLLRGPADTMASSFKAVIALDLPWLDTEALIPKAWKQIKEARGNTIRHAPIHFAGVAARAGEVDALIMLAKKLNGAITSPAQKDPYTRGLLDEATLILQQTIDADILDTKALVKLVLDNRDSLVFDKSSRKYRVRGTATAAAAK